MNDKSTKELMGMRKDLQSDFEREKEKTECEAKQRILEIECERELQIENMQKEVNEVKSECLSKVDGLTKELEMQRKKKVLLQKRVSKMKKESVRKTDKLKKKVRAMKKKIKSVENECKAVMNEKMLLKRILKKRCKGV